MTHSRRFVWVVFAFFLSFSSWLFAEEGILVIHVVDTHNKPIRGVRLTTRGDGSIGPPTDSVGKTRIRLAPQTRPNSEVSLQIAKAPKDMVFISPWDGRVRVPPFENESQNYVSIVLAERGSRELLANSKALASLAAKINTQNAPQTFQQKDVTAEQRRAVLEEQARTFGLKPDELDRAIRQWGNKTRDPYEKGLAALYTKNYPEATRQLSESLRIREGELKTTQAELADAASFLGQSLFRESKYRESVEAYQKAASLRPNDPDILNRLGLSWLRARNYAQAETVLKQSLAVHETLFGPEHTLVAKSLNNLGAVYDEQAKYAEAALFYKRALLILEKDLRPEHSALAAGVLSNLAGIYHDQGQYSEAEPLYKRSLSMWETVVAPDYADFAGTLDNYADLLRKTNRGNLAAEKESRAIFIRRKDREKTSTE